MAKIEECFKEYLAEVSWRDLRPHVQRDTLITLGPEIDIVEAASAVARDDSAQIEAWIAEGKLGKPTLDEVAAWEKQMGKPFRMLIVQPFILIQSICHA
jgi:hypothetical protein